MATTKLIDERYARSALGKLDEETNRQRKNICFDGVFIYYVCSRYVNIGK